MSPLFFLSSAFAPLSGRFAGWQGALVTYGLRTCLTVTLNQLPFYTISVYHLPTLFASFFFITKSPSAHNFTLQRWFTLGILSFCTLLFLAHPVGGQAWGYPLLWAIPLVALFCPSNLFCQAVSSTFIAHATGSVIWLYAGLGPITAAGWIALIPLVLVERFFLAGIMTFGILSIVKAKQVYKQKQRYTFALVTTVQKS